MGNYVEVSLKHIVDGRSQSCLKKICSGGSELKIGCDWLQFIESHIDAIDRVEDSINCTYHTNNDDQIAKASYFIFDKIEDETKLMALKMVFGNKQIDRYQTDKPEEDITVINDPNYRDVGILSVIKIIKDDDYQESSSPTRVKKEFGTNNHVQNSSDGNNTPSEHTRMAEKARLDRAIQGSNAANIKMVSELLALQETFLNKKTYRYRIPGYNTIDSKADLTKGGTWLLLAVRNQSSLMISEYKSSQTWLSGIVNGIWKNHFEDLAKDTSGNSRSSDKWQALLSEDQDYFPECDHSIKWEEITKALNNTPNNKAPGVDGIPSEIWMVVIEEKSPTSDLAKIIYKIISTIYNTGNIPSCMTTSIVVPVPKKGDMRDPDNYRGISLIPTLIKLLAKIVATKLAAIDQKYGLIAKEHAGFRSFEECAAQATTLYEIVKRRKLKNQETWICYVDYSKAYDRVPHMALVYKLRTVGIKVPGIDNKIPGLLFADDAVVLADSSKNLQISLNAIAEWSDTWEMAVNDSKCGIMAINCNEPTDLIL
ncbi:LINE-1 reverse transcriptase-like protein [Smittium culicis]|uniref:LINE-1 reverse transcriptase-like protein n=1 Tax=Smittium culicis TaxID=133412 RepID=A0A1R1Y1X3_9FUNG|nr:LINE-1 reverse transcriptase-like protein [Smittium culicis]